MSTKEQPFNYKAWLMAIVATVIGGACLFLFGFVINSAKDFTLAMLKLTKSVEQVQAVQASILQAQKEDRESQRMLELRVSYIEKKTGYYLEDAGRDRLPRYENNNYNREGTLPERIETKKRYTYEP